MHICCSIYNYVNLTISQWRYIVKNYNRPLLAQNTLYLEHFECLTYRRWGLTNFCCHNVDMEFECVMCDQFRKRRQSPKCNYLVCILWLLLTFSGSWMLLWCSAPVTSKLVLILPTSEGWQTNSTHLVLLKWHDRGSNSRPSVLKPTTLIVQQTPGLLKFQ